MTGRTLRLVARFVAWLLAGALLSSAAHAQWTPSGVSGQSTAPLSDPGRAMALASGARVLVVGQEDRRLSVVNPDTGNVLRQTVLPYEPRAVAVSSDGTRAYVVYGNSRLTAVDLAAGSVIGTWTVGGELRSVVLMPGEIELAIADAGPNRLLEVSTTTGAILRQLSLSHEPREVLRANGDSKLVVGAANGWLITVDGGSFSVLAQRKLADEIRSLAWWQAGSRVLAVHKRADAVSLFDIAANQVTSTVGLDGDPDRAAVAQSGSIGFVATHDDASVNRVDLAGPTLLGRYAIAARVNALVFDPVANVLYGALRSSSKLARLDPAAASLISVLQLQKRLRDIAVNPVTHEAVAVADKSDEMFIIKLSDRTIRQVALPARADLVAVDSVLNRAVIAFRGSGSKLRFADLGPGTLFSETISYDRDINALAVDPTRGLAVVITESERPVRVIDVAARAHLANGPEDRYRAVAVHSGRGVAYLATEDRKVRVMDLASRTITATVDLDFKANAIAVDETLDKAVLTTDTGDKAHVLDLATLQLAASHTLARNPGAVSLQTDTHVAVVASREADKLSLLDLSTGTASVGFTSIERPHSLAVSARYNQVLVLSGERDEVAFIDLPNPVPVLETLSPTQASAGGPLLVLTINGKGFVEASRAFFGSTQLVTRWLSATKLEADVPAALLATAAAISVTVQNPAPAGGTSNTLIFNIVGAPVLTAIAPSSAVADGQPKALQLSGSNFVSGATVLFGAVELAASVQSVSAIAVVVPGVLTTTPGPVAIKVRNPGGLESNAVTFTLTPNLAIQSVMPASAPVGAIITLAGTGFDPVPGNNTLVFRGINNTLVGAPALTATPTQITVRVPPLAETGPITLTNSRGIVQSPPFTVAREQDFQLVVSPTALTVYQGASNAAQAQLSSTGTRSFTGLVTLSVQGMPAGVSASFTPAATLSAFQAGTVTLTAMGAATPGNYPLTVQASFSEGGVAFVRSSSLTLTVASATGVTGVKGRFVTPEGQGIAGVIVRADVAANPQPEITTDAAGNFQLVGLPGGDVMLRIDATPANPQYPMWGYSTRLVTGTIARLDDWTITAPPPAEAFTSINNASQDQIVTDPRYPGLEIKLPAGVTIVGWDGVPKTRIAVQRLDADKAPIPAPPIPTRSLYQVFWGTPMGGLPSNGQPIPVTYPNDLNLEPGTKTEFWYYDAPPNGGEGVWRQNGTGTVSLDGKVIRTDPGSGIPRFCGVCGISCFLGNQGGGPPPPPPPCCPPKQNSSNRVEYATGQELPRAIDLAIPGLVPLELARAYHPRDPYAGIAGTALSLGFNWGLSYDVTLFQASSQQVRLILAGHNRTDFTPDGSGGFAAKEDLRYYGAVLRQVSGGWELKHKDGRTWRFAPFGGVGVFYLTEQRDKNDNALLIARSTNGRIANVQGGQRSLTFAYGGNGFVSEVTDQIGRKVKYGYNAQNVLQTVTLPDDETVQYTYVDDSEFAPIAACPAPPGGLRVKTIKMPGQLALQQLHYGPSKRALREVLPNGEELRFRYKVNGACVTHVSNPAVPCTFNCPTEDSWENFQAGWRIVGGIVSATTVVDANGKATTQRFNSSRIATDHTNNEGQATKFVRDTQNRIVRRVDALGRTWHFSYDANGNRTREIDPLGRVIDTEYDPLWNKPVSITRYLDGRPVAVRFEYEPNRGNLLKSIDARNKETRFTYTAQGRQASAYNVALDQTTTFGYNSAGDLVLLRDPLGNETAFEPDAVGRVVRAVDPRGFERLTEYNSFDRITRITDPALGLTQFDFDAKRDLRGIVNPLSKTIQAYEYDASHRLIRKTDARLQDELYAYDAKGDLSRLTDRKGQVADFAYDGERRLSRVDYVGGTRTQRYDAAGRLVEVREPDHAIAYAYDDADRLVRETVDSASARGEIVYEYDTLDRRTRRTVSVNGTPAEDTAYVYDDAGRLLTLTHRALTLGAAAPQTVSYVWDDGNRLAERTLPNGTKQVFSYDKANRITQIQYLKSDGTPIETVSYTYDAGGQRLSRSSSGASAQDTPFSAAYDEANRLTGLTLTATGQAFVLAYDDNGNLVSKTEQSNPANVTTYSWDSRNRLVGIAAPGLTASFAYDALDRRLSRTVNGETIGFVYDGLQVVGEIVNGQVGATRLTGLELDEALARVTQSGVHTQLTDALMSVLAQAKDDQSIQNYYAYTPYGEAIALGADEGNAIQYTARENDGTGLYYYRARYYDPILKRFISEDPIGVAGGLNFHAYVGGNPVSRTDPLGHYWIWVYRLIKVTIWGERIYRWVREWVDDPDPPCTGEFCGGGGSFGGGGASGSWGCMAECEERKAILFKKCVEDSKFDPTEAQVCMIKYRDMCVDACKDECPPGSGGGGGPGSGGGGPGGGGPGRGGGGASGSW